MTDLSTLWRERLLDWLTGASPAGNRYAALCSVAPGLADTGSTITEMTYPGYARLGIAFGATSNSRRKNSGQLLWAAPDAEISVVAVAVVTASSGGELVGWADFTPAVAFLAGQAPKFAVNTLALALVGVTSSV